MDLEQLKGAAHPEWSAPCRHWRVSYNMNKKRKIILRIHGTIIIFLGVALTINSTLGTYKGIGPFDFLSETPFVLVGLFQAYLLMALIGLTLWIGSYQDNPRKWHAVGALAHIPPLAANIMFYDTFLELEMQWASYIGSTIHCIFILVESVAFAYKGRAENHFFGGQKKMPLIEGQVP